MTSIPPLFDSRGNVVFDVSEYILSKIADRTFSAYGPIAQVELAEILRADGFTVAVEVISEYRNRNGRIDLVAGRRGILIGIEIDSWRTPKSKSVEKLLNLDALTHRVILLNHERNMLGRSVGYAFWPRKSGKKKIDFVSHLNAVFCSAEEKVALLSTARASLAQCPRDLKTIRDQVCG